ncbi:hypothetical protein Hanom_Chr13g01232831 [Helianthus anomalus]
MGFNASRYYMFVLTLFIMKQEKMARLEKQRMEFTKELEFHRLNMFMETQVVLEKK